MINMKGRATIRANTPSGRTPRHVELWTLEPKENTTLQELCPGAHAPYGSAIRAWPVKSWQQPRDAVSRSECWRH
jgi:hypothetical protein